MGVNINSHGVEIEIDPANFNDPRFAYTMSQILGDKTKDEDKLVLYGRMLDLVFGPENVLRVMDDLADANGGTLTNELFNEFFAEVMEQAGAKNS